MRPPGEPEMSRLLKEIAGYALLIVAVFMAPMLAAALG